jgi:1-phosphatidylinositol-4-phosphate 5-kinase
MIKTIKQDEVKTLLTMLPRYFHFMRKNGKKSLLTRFCGMYEVTFRQGDKDDGPHTFVVMNSVFPTEASRFISERFDLKGSTVGRECTIEEREAKGRNAVLKDLDLAREVELIKSLQKRGRYNEIGGYGIDVGSRAKAALMSQLRRDVAFLVACQVIDYSLLIGVAKESMELNEDDLVAMQRRRLANQRLTALRKGNPAAFAFTAIRMLFAPTVLFSQKTLNFLRRAIALPHPYYGSGRCLVDAGPFSQLPGRRMGTNAIYYFGLIDFLQPYNTKKAVEYHLKSVLYESNSFSCVPPEAYAERFLAFLDKHIV